MPYGFGPYFPFRRNNRKPDGTWDAPDATDENTKGTSVDPYQPMWPRWKQTPPPHGEGDFVSDQPFFDIDEISQKAEFYPPGRPLVDKNVDGNPASRQRVGDMPGGNLWRRRLLVGGFDPDSPTKLAQDAGSPSRPVSGLPTAAPWGAAAKQLQLLYNQTRPNTGDAGWAVDWRFDRLPDNGFVMQKIQRHEETPTGEKINPVTFWEFWPVSKYGRETDLQRELRTRPRILKPGQDAHTPDDTLGQVLGGKSKAGNTVVVHSDASLWIGEKIPDAAKISPESSARGLRIMTTDPGLVPDPGLSIKRGYSRPLR